MGMTIHYDFASKQKLDKIKGIVYELHKFARSLPFESVGKVVQLQGDQCDFNKRDRDDPISWMMIQARYHIELKTKKGLVYDAVSPTQVIGFPTWPGRGCEMANFGLAQYPEKMKTNDGLKETKLDGWQWRSFCKTQYASDPRFGGMNNLVKCHLLVIAMLDKAKKLGILEHVSDGGDYWKSRDLAGLVGETNSMNQIVAAVAGHIKDAGGEGVVAPITEFANFEKLEAEGQAKVPLELIQLIKQTRK